LLIVVGHRHTFEGSSPQSAAANSHEYEARYDGQRLHLIG